MESNQGIIEELFRNALLRIPAYELSKKVIQAHIDMVERGMLFTSIPEIEGEHFRLAPSIEERCKAAVITELRKVAQEIDDHLERLRLVQELKAT